eukprot:8879708-Heterocapsa_arctica.AAC.1
MPADPSGGEGTPYLRSPSPRPRRTSRHRDMTHRLRLLPGTYLVGVSRPLVPFQGTSTPLPSSLVPSGIPEVAHKAGRGSPALPQANP